MRRTGRLLVATVIAGVAVLASAGVAEAGGLGDGGDSGDSGDRGDRRSHHKSHSDSDDSDDSSDSDCRGCVHADEECCEDEPIHYEPEYECADGGLQDIPGFGAVPVVATSETCGEDEE